MPLAPSLRTRIVNVVATAVIPQQIDLNRVGQLPWGSYDGHSFGGHVAYFKKIRMKGKVAMYNTGKLISVGTTSEEAASSELREALLTLIDEGIVSPASLKISIQNVVAVGDIRRRIDLEALSMAFPTALYEPTQFSTVMIPIKEKPKVVASVSSVGTFMLSGAKSTSSAKQMARNFTRTLVSFADGAMLRKSKDCLLSSH